MKSEIAFGFLVVFLLFVVVMTWVGGMLVGGQFDYHPPTCVYDWDNHKNVCKTP